VLEVRYERVLLVQPANRADWRGLVPHVGLGYLAEYLSAKGIECQVLDLNLERASRLESRLASFRPQLVGVSLITLGYRDHYALIRRIKRLAPRALTVAGGPHVAVFRERVIEECPELDAAVLREGEHTLLELCEGQAPEKVRGLFHRRNGRVAFTGDRELIADLDGLPWPRYRAFRLARYIPERTIYSTRGCPQRCIFCTNPLLQPIFRARSAASVGDEMEYWYSRGTRLFNFDDDNFNLIRQRVFDICDEVERRGLRGLALRCSNGIRADRVDRLMLARMREVGFRYLAFGVDGGNNRVLEIVRKGETIETIEAAIAAAVELGYEVKCLFVVGTPGEGPEDVEDKVRLVRRYPIHDVHFYNIIPYPGTELYRWIEERGLFLIPPERYLNDVTAFKNIPVFETPELPAAERVRLFGYLARVRRDVHRQAAQRLFGRHPLVGRLAGYLAGNGVFQNLFYQNALVRRTADLFRYGAGTRSAS
jgi:anaerobic magnesium-protoporphyrin IX monomethyl ester cyclase